MTKADFLTGLEKAEQVEFPGSILSAPTAQVCDILCAALMTILSEKELIRFGVQTSAFAKDTWKGQLVWLLVLRGHLLKVTCTARVDASGENAQALLIAHQIYPIDSTLRVESTLEYPPTPRTPKLTGIDARITLGGAHFDIKAEGTRAGKSLLAGQGVGAFIAALLDAATESFTIAG